MYLSEFGFTYQYIVHAYLPECRCTYQSTCIPTRVQMYPPVLSAVVLTSAQCRCWLPGSHLEREIESSDGTYQSACVPTRVQVYLPVHSTVILTSAQCRCRLPRGHLEGEIEGSDGTDHTQRLPSRVTETVTREPHMTTWSRVIGIKLIISTPYKQQI